MNEENPNIVIEQLRALRNDIAEFRIEAREKFSYQAHRLSMLEQHFALLVANLPASNDRFDSLERRLNRIESKLELVGGAT
jgi:predicted RNase H-like nuclease (RuvC/YqgF family)